MPAPLSYRYQGVLGTDLHVLVGGATEDAAEHAQARVVDEIVRLDGLLSTHGTDTPLARWVAGDDGIALPAEAVAVLAAASRWYARSDGAFHPALGAVLARWRQSERDGHLPDPAECRDLVERSRVLPYVVDGDRVERTGDTRVLALDALAKGWVVDRAAEAGLRGHTDGALWVMVNVGGDLRVAGPGSVRVGVEDPAYAVDNADPLGVVEVTSALASSGSARRGFRVDGRWFGHVVDPRTGWPVDEVAGATVIARDAATADVLATVVGVAGLDHPRAQALLREEGAAAVAVSTTGRVSTSPTWRDHAGSGFVATG